MNTAITMLTAAFTAVACSNGPDAVEASSATPLAVATVQASLVAAPADSPSTGAPERAQFKLTSPRARALVAGGTVSQRAPGARISTGTIAKIAFASKEDGAFMRGAAERLLGAAGPSLQSLRSLTLKTDEGLLLLPVQGAVAYSVPESGSYTVRRAVSTQRATVLQTAEEAVDAALAGISKYGLLALGPSESLDVVSVTALFRNQGGDGPLAATDKVAYQVHIGRLYRGTQVLGPPSLVELDADGDIATFRKSWRDITGESGALDIADDVTIGSRRDKLMSKYLSLKESSCGYTEDPDPGTIQAAAGAGCHYVYNNPDSKDPMNRQTEDWVNAALDPSVPMRGVRKAAIAGP